MPAPSRLIMPARIINLWLATSASAGASFSVETKNWEAFMDWGSAGGHRIFTNLCHAWGQTRARVVFAPSAIMVTVQESGSDYARQRGLPAQRRHCAAQLAQPGVLGQAASHAFLAVP